MKSKGGLESAMAVFLIVLGALGFLLLGTSLSHAGRLSTSLAPFRMRPVDVRAWGSPLPDADGGTFEIESIKAFGAGLHIFLRREGGRPRHLKVAQPRSARLDEGTAVIGEAAYVQWAGRRLARVGGSPALTLTLR